MNKPNTVKAGARTQTLTQRYHVTLTGNDEFHWSKVIESGSCAGAVNEALQSVGLTKEQIINVEADLLSIH